MIFRKAKKSDTGNGSKQYIGGKKKRKKNKSLLMYTFFSGKSGISVLRLTCIYSLLQWKRKKQTKNTIQNRRHKSGEKKRKQKNIKPDDRGRGEVSKLR